MTEWYWSTRAERIEELPRNHMGKVEKARLRTWLTTLALPLHEASRPVHLFNRCGFSQMSLNALMFRASWLFRAYLALPGVIFAGQRRFR
jgi:hypothetical protein